MKIHLRTRRVRLSGPDNGHFVRRLRRCLTALCVAGVLVFGMGVSGAAARAQEQPAATPAPNKSGAESTPAAQSPEKNQQEVDENDQYRHSASVAAIGRVFGLNPEQAATAFTLLNLIVLVVLVGWLLLRVLPKFFRDRTGHIQKQLVDARAATEEANARLSGVEDRLSRLDGEIAALRSQAERDAAVEEERVRASVEDEKSKILAAAEQEITAASTQARRQIQQFAAELAIEQAAKKLVVSAETDRLLVQEFSRGLGETNPRGGQN